MNKIVLAITVLVLFWITAELAVQGIDKIAKKSNSQRQPLFHLLSIFTKTALYLIGIVSALGSAGINVSALVASLGLGGLAISIATKDAFSNLCGGIMILFYQPFKIGQVIQVGDMKGEVDKINLRYTHLINDDKTILIPNANLLTQNITIIKNNHD